MYKIIIFSTKNSTLSFVLEAESNRTL